MKLLGILLLSLRILLYPKAFLCGSLPNSLNRWLICPPYSLLTYPPITA
jgi:hypothetical protein